MCSECGEPIPTARLKEKPNTTLCVGCKTKLEKQPKSKTRENPEKVKQKRHKLPERLERAILTLPLNKEIVVGWQAVADSDVADDLAKANALVNRLTSAFARKEVFDPMQLMKIQAALRQARNEVASIVSKAMNTEANKLRQALKTINATFEDKKAILSVDSRNRKFLFSIEERPNFDEVLTMLSKAGIE